MDAAMQPHLRALIVEDSEDDALIIARHIRKGGHELSYERVEGETAMRIALSRGGWDIIISDVNLPGFSAAGALALHREFGGDEPFIVISGVIGEETAVSLLKAGAHDFLLKENLARLVPAIERELRESKLRRAHREAERALRISEERYALAARGSNDGLWDWDLARDRIYLSPRWKDMMGHAEDEIGDAPAEWLGRVHPDDIARVTGALDDHLAGRTPHFAIEHRVRHGDGGWHWMLARGLAVRDGRGSPGRIAGSLTETTARKAAERQLMDAKDSLERALAARTRFLAAASHDLRQPVQALLYFINVLELRLRDHPALDLVREMEVSLDGLRALLDSLLDVSRLDAGLVAVNRADVPLDSLLAQLAAEMRPLAEDKGLVLRLVPSRLTVRSDPVLLGRVIRNLLQNAIRYSDKGAILLGCRRQRGRARIEVWDTGIGIPETNLQQIFEEFYQVGNSERDRRQGLGLGLPIVQRLCQLLGHDLSVRSREGAGSVFSVGIPLAEGASQPVPASRDAGRRPVRAVTDC